MATKTSGSDQPKSMDVSKKAASSPTSRPIIVNHGPIMQDPMVNKDENDNQNKEETASEPGNSRTSSARKVIKVPENMATEAEGETKPNPETDAGPGNGDTNETTGEEATPDQQPSNSYPNETPSEKVGNVKKQDEAAKQEAAAAELDNKKAKIQKLIANKKYFVNVSKTNSNKTSVILLILIIAILVAAVAAVDAGLVDLGITLPFDLIPDNV